MTDKSDDRVGHLNTILALGGRNLNHPIFKSSNAGALPGRGEGKGHKRVSNWHFAETFASVKINKAMKKNVLFLDHHEFCFSLEIWSKIVMWLNHDPFP